AKAAFGAMDAPCTDLDRIRRMVPNQLNITLEHAIEESSQLKDAYEKDEQVRELLETAKKLEGLVRNSGVHAAGVVIAPRPLTELVPLHKTKNDEIVTAFDMVAIEKLGLLKMDFLGLTTLTILDDTIDRKHGRKKIEYELPELKEILEETLGVIVYQEQVMQIANRLAGYSLGEADLLRRAMGKKKPEEMAQQRERFVDGAAQRNF